MPQEPTPEELELRAARSRLINTALTRQRLTHRKAVVLVNKELGGLDHDPISRVYLSMLAKGTRPLTPKLVTAVALALGIEEAQLRHPFVDLSAVA